jgi:hypothetical protein
MRDNKLLKLLVSDEIRLCVVKWESADGKRRELFGYIILEFAFRS